MKPDYSIRAADRVCDILDLLQRSTTGATLTGIAEVTKLPKSSALRYLSTLEARRYVERDPDTGRYHITFTALPHRNHGLEILRSKAVPYLTHLRNTCEETVNLGCLDGTRIRYMEICESQRGVRLAARKGDRDPLHSTALGKAVAVLMPRERVVAILEKEGMWRLTARTIVSVDRYLAELDRVRSEGYALDDGENEADGRCVAVPVNHPPLLAAVSVSAPAARFPVARIGAVVSKLTAIANRLADEMRALEQPST